MAQLSQSLNGLRRHRLLNAHRPVQRLAGLGEARADAYSRRIQRLLRVQFADNLAQQDLDVSLRLHEAAHDAKGRVQRAVLEVGRHGWDDGVIWPLSGLQLVRVVGVEREVCAAVLEGEAAALGDDARAEAAVVGVDEGGGVAVRVGHGEVDGVAALEGRRGEVWLAVLDEIEGALGVEERSALEEILLREEALDGHGRDVGVGNVPAAVGKGQAESFDDGVEIGRGVEVLGLERGDLALLLELLDDAEGHEGDDALAVGRVFPELDAFVGSFLGEALAAEFERDGFDGLAAQFKVMLQILQCEVAAEILDDLDELVGYSASVEAPFALFSQCAECLGQGRILHDFGWTRGSDAVCLAGIDFEHFCVVGGGIPDEMLCA